jgi:phage gpG-like protein
MKDLNQLGDDLNALARDCWKLQGQMPRIVGVIGVNFVRTNFDKEGFQNGTGTDVWAKRKHENSRSVGKKVLSDRRNLRDAVRYDLQGDTVMIGIDGDKFLYGKLHNEGGEVEISDKQRAFFWAQHREHSRKTKTRTGKVSKSKSAQAHSAEAEQWKRLALAKGPLKYPKRKFLGMSPALWQEIDAEVQARLKAIFSKHGFGQT